MGEFKKLIEIVSIDMRYYIKKDIYIPVFIYIPIFGIIIAELLMFSGGIFYGLGIHIINLLFIIDIIIFSSLEEKEKNVLQSLILVILLRIINLSAPQFFATALLQYSLIYGIMILPIYYVVKNQQISAKELGIDFRINKIKIYLPVAILIGIIMAIIEYKILNPKSLIEDIKISNIVLIITVMFVFVASIEEIVFRSIIQTRIENIYGSRHGIVLNGILFGIMHASYGIMIEIIFAIIFGIILGYIFYKTKSIPFTVMIHGTANAMTFGILSKILI